MANKFSLLKGCTTFEYASNMITESRKKNDGKVILSGVLQRADTVNQNGRIYPKDILGREIRNYQKLIAENRSTGELDHPDSSVVTLANLSHIIREAHMNTDGAVEGRVEILNTPNGKILQNLLDSGVKLGISSRGVGSTKKKDGYDIVQDDFQLICWDFVSEPSTPGAFMLTESKILNEVELNKIFTHSDRINRIVNDVLLHCEDK